MRLETRLKRQIRALGASVVADRLGVSASTVRRWAREGIPPGRDLSSVTEDTRSALSAGERGELRHLIEQTSTVVVADSLGIPKRQLENALRGREVSGAVLEGVRQALNPTIPLSPREKRERSEQVKLAQAEVARIQRFTIRSHVAAADVRRSFVERGAYCGRQPVTRIREKDGAFRGVDAWKRPVRMYAVGRKDTGEVRFYWTRDRDFTPPEAQAAEGYEELKDSAYFVETVFN